MKKDMDYETMKKNAETLSPKAKEKLENIVASTPTLEDWEKEYGEKFGSGNGLFRTSEAYFYGRDFIKKLLAAYQARVVEIAKRLKRPFLSSSIVDDDNYNQALTDLLALLKEI